jgi:rhamnulokinase
VDYGLLDARGDLVAPPVSYRDDRTSGYLSTVERIGGVETLYGITGLQLQPYNTVFQVAAHDRAELSQARHLLMLPELLVHHLTGEVLGEPTSAGTTGLVDIRTGVWSDQLAGAVGLDPALLPPLAAAGSRVGVWQGVPVHLVGGHDTASAVAAMGADVGPGSGFVSAGTWFIVGSERDAPDLSASAREANFTNEIGALGGIRFLKNLAGAWLVERCRPAWGEPSVSDLMAAAAERPESPGGSARGEPGLDVADPRYLNPTDMLAEVTAALGLAVDAPAPAVVRGIVEAQAKGTATVLDQLGDVRDVHVFGGAQSQLYQRLLAERTGLVVHAGPVEATALGNALVQGVALGLYDDLAHARRSLRGLEVSGS